MADIRVEVRTREGCFEYCRISDALVSTPFQLDHIIAEKHGGPTTLENLSWSCLDCNSFKGPNIAGRDANQTIRLFVLERMTRKNISNGMGLFWSVGQRLVEPPLMFCESISRTESQSGHR